MKRALQAYDTLIFAMAWLAGALMAGMFAAIVIDVVLEDRVADREPGFGRL